MPTTIDPWSEEGRRFENVSEKPESRHEKEKHTMVEDVEDGCHVQTHVWVLGKPYEQNVEQMGKKGWDLSANQRFRHEKKKRNGACQGRMDEANAK